MEQLDDDGDDDEDENVGTDSLDARVDDELKIENVKDEDGFRHLLLHSCHFLDASILSLFLFLL